MDDLAAIERELDVARESDDNDERARLLPLALALPEAQPHRGDYLDELAYAYEQLGRFDEAIDTIHRALAAGWDGELEEYPSPQALIADLLFRAGRLQEGHEAWRAAERETPHDPSLHQAAANAYTNAGLHVEALAWQTKGLELALRGGEDTEEAVWLLTEARAETLSVLRRKPDELQLRAAEVVELQGQEDREWRDQWDFGPVPPRPAIRTRVDIGVAWFPVGQYERALGAWPRFAKDHENAPYATYCSRLELRLRELKAQGDAQRTARLGLAPIAIDEYLLWCAPGRDPAKSATRDQYAAELVGRAMVEPWPPQRNERCWCGSGRKYKKCCLRTG